MTGAAQVDSRHGRAPLAGGVAPSYDGLGLANVAPTLLQHFGLDARRPTLRAEALPPEALAGAERVVLVVVDGLGWDQFARSPLRALFPQSAPITSVLPSTTVAALASLACGEAPATHGLLGYRMLLPRLGAVTNLIRMQPYYASRTAFDLGVTPEEMFPFDTLTGRLAAAGVATTVVTRGAYVASELSRMIYRGLAPDAGVLGYVGLADGAVRARRTLEATRGRRAFLELYWDEVDTVAHRYGPKSDEHEAAVRQLAVALEDELIPATRDGRTAVVLVADHGHVHVPRENVINLNEHVHLLDDLLLPPTGEGRFAYLHPRDGRREAVRDAFEREFGRDVLVLNGEDLIADGYFGPPPHHPEIFSRVGGLVAIPQGARKIEYHATPRTGPMPLLGNHGGTAPEEMLVPLAVLGAS